MPMYKRPLVVLIGLIILIAGGSYLYMHTSEEDSMEDLPSTTEESSGKVAGSVTVYIAGEVKNPGLVTLNGEARIGDAVKACGGFTEEADQTKVNLAKHLEDGVQITVLKKRGLGGGGVNNPHSSASGGNAGASSGDSGVVSLNSASVEELAKLPGVGPKTAQKIIEYREQHGGFQQIEDVMKVKGIGKAKFAKIKDHVEL